MSPVELLPRWKDPPEGETATHFYAREGEIIFRWTIRVLVVITIVMMAIPAIGYFAWIPATLLVVAYGIRLLINTVESRTGFGRVRKVKGTPKAPSAETEKPEAPAPEPVAEREATEPPAEVAAEPEREEAPAHEPAWQRSEFSERLVRHEAKIIGVVIFVVFIIAAIVGIWHLGWKLLLLSVPVVFAYILLLGWPVWFAAIEEDVERSEQESDESSTVSSHG